MEIVENVQTGNMVIDNVAIENNAIASAPLPGQLIIPFNSAHKPENCRRIGFS